jgi:hypothetical protein
MVLGRFQQTPPGQGGEGSGQDLVVHRVAPAHGAQRRFDLVEVQGRRQDCRLVESGHQSNVEIAQLCGGEPEQIRVSIPPWTMLAHGQNLRWVL